MHIDIHIPRPGVLLLALTAVAGWGMYFQSSPATEATVIQAQVVQQSSSEASVAAAPFFAAAQATQVAIAAPVVSSPVLVPPQIHEEAGLTQAEIRVKRARAEQEFLRQKEDILRAQLDGLQKEREALGPNIDPILEEQFKQSVLLLTSLVKDQRKAEEFLLTNYRQEWEAEEKAMAAATGSPTGEVRLFWPVDPALGISAHFKDPAYKARFKVEHYAIDIPVLQGTTVLSAADGIVKDVVDHGIGYNFITVDHGGYATVYGHMSRFSVRVGQHVRAGDVLGLSGGMPGLPGGGSSTGPHLHFGLYIKGVPVDPLPYLPPYEK